MILSRRHAIREEPFSRFTRVNIYIYILIYVYTSMHEVRIIVAISVWLVVQTRTIKSDIASAGMCSKRSIEYVFARRFFLYVAWWSVARLLTLRERVAIVCRTGPLVSFLRSGSSCNTNIPIFIFPLIDLQFCNTIIWINWNLSYLCTFIFVFAVMMNFSKKKKKIEIKFIDDKYIKICR